jgi:ribonuclease Z
MTSSSATIDNAPYQSLYLGGLTLQGHSRAGIQSYWRIPELRIGFDLGLLPWAFTETSPWFVTHAHLDHFLALPALLARRRMMGLPPPTVYVPAEVIDDVQNLMRAWERLDKGQQECELLGLRPDDEVELPSKHIVRAFATTHTVPSRGYVVLEPRRKLKDEYRQLPGEAIRDLRAKGVEVSDPVRVPLFAYTGDTNADVFDANPFLFETKTLLIEMSFLHESPSPPTAHRHGHLHLEDFLARADRFENELLIATHFSSRYTVQEVRETLEARLPPRLKERVRAWVE